MYRWAQRYVRDAATTPGVGAGRVIGLIGFVTAEIAPDDTDRRGRVSIAGETWGALADGDSGIALGQKVRVLAMQGTRVVVTPVQEE
jgi:membrane protein implicated in regulation of membrane protease activity